MPVMSSPQESSLPPSSEGDAVQPMMSQRVSRMHPGAEPGHLGTGYHGPGHPVDFQQPNKKKSHDQGRGCVGEGV